MTEKIYIASKPVLFGYEHLYLVYDPDGVADSGDEKVIRGGPDSAIPPYGNIIVEDGFDIAFSEDDLGSDTTSDRNYTELTVSGDVSTVWTEMISFVRSMAELDGQGNIVRDLADNNQIKTVFDYDLVPAEESNSNSIIASVLASQGIKLEDQTPKLGGTGARMNISTFLGAEVVYGGDENDTLTIGDDVIFVDSYKGNDTIYGNDLGTEYQAGDGNDSVYAGTGNDKIYGGVGNDTLSSGGGNVDLLDGGTGDDHYVIDANTTNATIIDNDGEANTLRLHGVSLSDDVEAIRAADDLLLSFTDSTGDIRNIVLRDSYSGSTLQTSVDNLVLDDGTFNIATFISANGTEFETTGDEAIWGSIQSETTTFTDTINGGFAYLNDGWDTHNGSASNDFLSGGSGEDTLRGKGGNDLIYGGDDKDYLFGNDGNDRIYGGDGQDEIRGNDGNDSLYGNDGNDRIYTGSGIDYVDGGSGEDWLFLNDGYEIDVDLSNNAVNDNGHGQSGTVLNVENIRGTFGNDLIIGDSNDNKLEGMRGVDTIYGGAGNDTINGGQFGTGSRLYGEAGNDTFFITSQSTYYIDGGSDTDTLLADNFETQIDLEQGFVNLKYGVNQNSYSTLSSIENFTGSSYSDTIFGNNDNNILSGGSNSSGNEDYINALGGDDEITIQSGVVHAGAGSDDVFAYGSNGVTATYIRSENVGATDRYFASFGGATDTIQLYFSSGELTSSVQNDLIALQDEINDASSYNYSFNSFNLTIGSFDEAEIYVDSQQQSVNALAIDDLLTVATNATLNGNVLADNGNGADDAIDGVTVTSTSPITTSLGNTVTLTASGTFTYVDTLSIGTDTFAYQIQDGRGNTDTGTATIVIQSKLDGTSSGETVTGDANPNQINGLGGNDNLQGQNGDDTINGGDGNDFIRGGNGNDIIYGGIGNDSLYGDLGNDFIYGEDGNDTFVSKGGDTVFDGGSGFNTANYTVLGFSGGIDANLATGKVTKSDGSIDTLSNVDRLLATSSNDFIQGGDNGETLDGKAGNDTIYGGLGNDFIYGDAGDDFIDGQGGLDTLKAGAGNDTIFGGADTDSLWGEDGNDIIYGLGGDDIFVGSAGNDDFYGGTGTNKANYNFMGGAITANLDLTSGQVTKHDLSVDDLTDIQVVMGSGYNDTISGGHNIILQGYNGDDTLTGGSGADFLYGQNDNDILHGSGGNDRLYGGSGDDTFLFNRGGGVDRIINDDSVSTNDRVEFGSTGTVIEHDQLWFEQSGNHLLVSVIGTNDTMTMENWYTTGHTVDHIDSGDGYTLTSNEVQTLVNAMVLETKPSFGQTDMPTQTQSNLDATLASVWDVAA